MTEVIGKMSIFAEMYGVMKTPATELSRYTSDIFVKRLRLILQLPDISR